MHTETIPLDETHYFSQFFIDYLKQNKALAPYYRAYPSLANFKEAIRERSLDDEGRTALVSALNEQYKGIAISETVSANIQHLGNSKTFTITTGHQLNIFTGPLYFIYKIVTVINACKTLKESYPDYHFVPVYWMASEDHDFDEINHFFFDGKKYQWQTDQKGAVGRFDPSDLVEIAARLPKSAAVFREAYAQPTLAQAVRYYVNELFGEHGLVVLDADHPQLKARFSSIIEDDLFQHTPQKKVASTSAALEALGYKPQVYPRQINFFYLNENLRERIEVSEAGFSVVNTHLTFSEKQMQTLIQEHPERFSPNVILRPLYQEVLLPNLAYVGGPSEIVYWLQLKDLFDHYGVAFPLLMPRNFATIIPRAQSTKWKKTGLDFTDLFLTADEALEKWIRANTKHDLSFSDEIAALKETERAIKRKVEAVDTTLSQHVEALFSTFTKKVHRAEKKLLRAEKRLHEDRKRQIVAVKESLFPEGSLQERRDNFLNFYTTNPNFLPLLLHTFDPFNFGMYLIFDDF